MRILGVAGKLVEGFGRPVGKPVLIRFKGDGVCDPKYLVKLGTGLSGGVASSNATW